MAFLARLALSEGQSSVPPHPPCYFEHFLRIYRNAGDELQMRLAIGVWVAYRSNGFTKHSLAFVNLAEYCAGDSQGAMADN